MPDTSQVTNIEVACNGGLVLDKTSLAIPEGAATVLQNFEPSIQGGYRRINGFTTFDSNALPGTGNVLGIAFLGANVIACRGANVAYSSGSGWTSIDTSRTSAGRYHFDVYDWDNTEKLVMASGDAGTNYAATWDGSTYVLLNGSVGSGTGTAPTNPLDVKEHKGHLFFLQGQELTWSSPFNENKFDPSDGAGVINLSDTGVGMKSYRDILYILCEKSIYRLSGSSISDFQLVPVTKNIGCVSGWSIQEAGGDVIFLAPDGLRNISGTEQIGDVNISIISKSIQNRINNLNSTDYQVSSLVVRDKSQYRMWYVQSLVAETQNSGIIGVIKQGQQGLQWEYADLVGMKPSIAASGYLEQIEYFLHGGWSDGIIYQQESGDTFNGTAIDARFRTPDYSFGDVGIRKMCKRVILNIEFEGGVSPDLGMEYDYNSGDVTQPAVVSVGTPGYIGVYGVGTYGNATYTSTLAVASIRSWVLGSGFLVAFTLNENDTNGPFTIQGFQIEIVPGGRR
tara:strand:- start:503 stop:2029 length:1527 start_codon:yes stop_codon:yes gene_type:complete